MNSAVMKTRMPNIGPIQLWMLGNDVHAYMKQPGMSYTQWKSKREERRLVVYLIYLPKGNNMAATNAEYSRASGPILPTLRLQVTFVTILERVARRQTNV